MTPEEKSLLERTYHLAEENNKILRGIRRANRWGIAWKIFYWVVIIGLSVGALYFIQPYVQVMLDAYGQIQGGIQGINESLDQANSAADSIRNLLK